MGNPTSENLSLKMLFPRVRSSAIPAPKQCHLYRQTSSKLCHLVLGFFKSAVPTTLLTVCGRATNECVWIIPRLQWRWFFTLSKIFLRQGSAKEVAEIHIGTGTSHCSSTQAILLHASGLKLRTVPVSLYHFSVLATLNVHTRCSCYTNRFRCLYIRLNPHIPHHRDKL